MSKAFECDRCSRFEGGDPACKVTITRPNAPVNNERTATPELCSRCLVSLEDWLDAHKRDQEVVR